MDLIRTLSMKQHVYTTSTSLSVACCTWGDRTMCRRARGRRWLVPRGGKRIGKPGVAHAQRTDLNGPQPIRTAPGQSYGVAQMQREAQQVIPVAGTQVAPVAQQGGGGSPPALPVQPGSLGWTDASRRPDEPVTAGLPLGAGPGPEALGGALSANDDVQAQLRAVYMAHPTEQLRELLEALDDDDV